MNIPRRAFGLLFLLAAPAVGQQDSVPPPPTIELPAELARVLTAYETAYRLGGVDLAALFTDDGFVLPRGRPPIRGRSAIAEYYGGGGGPLALRAIAFGVDESIAYIIGGYAENPASPDAGKFTLTLHKAPDSRWLIFSDMDNSNRRQ